MVATLSSYFLRLTIGCELTDWLAGILTDGLTGQTKRHTRELKDKRGVLRMDGHMD